MSASFPPTPCIILAGGEARRLGGGDKTLRMVDNTSILSRVVARMTPQCDGLVISANGDPARFADTSLPVVADSIGGLKGPLAGILAGLDWAAVHRPRAEWMASVAGDTPFLPDDLIARLHAARATMNADIAAASSGGRTHHIVALWRIALRDDLRHALLHDDLRQVGLFASRYRAARAAWPTEPFDPFFNINTTDDLARADEIAARHRG